MFRKYKEALFSSDRSNWFFRQVSISDLNYKTYSGKKLKK
jgi:hypothetical protein